jgi:hypothetical protein
MCEVVEPTKLFRLVKPSQRNVLPGQAKPTNFLLCQAKPTFFSLVKPSQRFLFVWSRQVKPDKNLWIAEVWFKRLRHGLNDSEITKNLRIGSFQFIIRNFAMIPKNYLM